MIFGRAFPAPSLVESAAVDVAGTLDVPAPTTAQCVNCEARFVLLPGQDFPPKWMVIAGELVCADCAPPAPGALKAAIGGAHSRKFHGCRIGHEIAFGNVALQIRAGFVPPPGRDERVQFMLSELELDEMIVELRAIRAELRAIEGRG